MSKKRLKSDVSKYGIEGRIFIVRGQSVLLDSDLARIYNVTTKAFNQAVKRNIARFPSDFAFRLTSGEAHKMRSQIVTASKRNVRYLPYVFTEHGALMAANILNSSRAVMMSVYVVRAFIKLREALVGNRALAEKLADLERKLTSRLNVHEEAIVRLFTEIRELLNSPPPGGSGKPKRRIGFHP